MLTSITKSFMISIKSYVRENMRNEMENLGSIKVVPNYFSGIKFFIKITLVAISLQQNLRNMYFIQSKFIKRIWGVLIELHLNLKLVII